VTKNTIMKGERPVMVLADPVDTTVKVAAAAGGKAESA